MRKILAALAFLTLGLAQELVVLTHSSFSLDKALIARFQEETGIRLRFLKGGDAGETLNKAILSKGAPSPTSSTALTTPSSPGPSRRTSSSPT